MANLEMLDEQISVGDVKTITYNSGKNVKFIELLFSPTTKVMFAPSADKSNLEIKQILRKVVGFFYDPSGELNTFMGGNMHQSLLRSHLDIYTTICALWGLKPVGYTFGVNALSSEPTFVYNPVTFTIYTDNYLYSVKRPSDAIIYNDYDKMRIYAEVSKIELYKKCIDGCLKYNLFQNYHA